MNSHFLPLSGRRHTGRHLARTLAIAALVAAAPALWAQADSTTSGNGSGGSNANDSRAARRAARGNFNPEEMQQRLLSNLRDQFGVTDDAEWKIISDRVLEVAQLRRSTGGGFGSYGGFRGQSTQGGNRGSRNASPEQDALRDAITNKLPDAEIKSRLERLREVRKANEEKLTKAQEDLRAVLSVRQEAIAVMVGLLP